MNGSSRPLPVTSTDWLTSMTGVPGSILSRTCQPPSTSVSSVATFGS
jgi:hypothetical protein